MTTETRGAALDAPNHDAAAAAAASRDETAPLFSALGVVRGRNVTARNAVIGGIAADQVNFERGLVRMVLAGDRADIRQAGAQLVVAGGDVSVERGGAQAIVANGSVRLERGGAGLALARRVEVGEGGIVVFGLTPSLNLTGGRVIIGPAAALAMIGAILASVVVAVGLRRRRA